MDKVFAKHGDVGHLHLETQFVDGKWEWFVFASRKNTRIAAGMADSVEKAKAEAEKAAEGGRPNGETSADNFDEQVATGFAQHGLLLVNWPKKVSRPSLNGMIAPKYQAQRSIWFVWNGNLIFNSVVGMVMRYSANPAGSSRSNRPPMLGGPSCPPRNVTDRSAIPPFV